MKKTGFTLVEILIVVIILGILASIAVAKFCWASEMAREATAKADLTTLSKQLEFYRIQHGDSYPWEIDEVGEDLSLVIEQLTQRTNAYGDVMPEGGNPRQYKYGPYLNKFPTYLFARGNSPDAEVTFDDVICFDDGGGDDYDFSGSPPIPGGDSATSGGPSSSASPPSSSWSFSSGRGRLRATYGR